MLRLQIHPAWLPRLINRIIVQHLILGCYFLFDALAFALLRPLQLMGWISLVFPLLILHFFAAGRIYRQCRYRQKFPLVWHTILMILSTLALWVLFFIWKRQAAYAFIGWIHLFLGFITLFNGWLEYRALHHTELIFTHEGIQVPDQWRWLRIPWAKIAAVVMKEDVFTLQLTDERWWQWQIQENQENRLNQLRHLLQEHLSSSNAKLS
ncbi:MAG: hypothetical protein IRZ29_02100 [Thermoflavifilum sp.]|nr:hypothetical protein [Thermoflavifilum sp.]